MGALRLAWADLQRGRLDQQEAERIRSTVAELVEDLESDIELATRTFRGWSSTGEA